MNNQTNAQDPAISQRISERLASLGVRAPAALRSCVTKATSRSRERSSTNTNGTPPYAPAGMSRGARVVDQMQVIPSGQHWEDRSHAKR